MAELMEKKREERREKSHTIHKVTCSQNHSYNPNAFLKKIIVPRFFSSG
jgi:hypothetical protein